MGKRRWYGDDGYSNGDMAVAVVVCCGIAAVGVYEILYGVRPISPRNTMKFPEKEMFSKPKWRYIRKCMPYVPQNTDKRA